MPIKFISLFFIYAFIFFVPAFANVWNNKSSTESIIPKLPELNDITCKFKQEKIIPDIDKALISSGDFKFIKNEGVYFYINYPVQSTVDYTNKNYKQINDVIKAIASKKYKKLEKEFDFYFENMNNNNWKLGLKPKEKTAEFLSSIIIEGSDYIQKIKIEMINGNITTIWFTK